MPKVSGGADQDLELGKRNFANPCEVQHPRRTQLPESYFYIGPVGVLGKVGTHDYFKPAAGRPPVLPPPSTSERGVDGGDLFFKKNLPQGQ